MKLSELSGKKIAVGFFGISYKESYDHWCNWITNIDWRRSNYRQTVLRILESNGNQVDHYMSTYHHEHESELLSDFSPKKVIMNEFEPNRNKNSWVATRHKRFKELIGLFDEDCEYYIVTRFDLKFSLEHLMECRIQDNSINVTSKWGIGSDMNFICDCFYIFQKDMLQVFKKFINGISAPRDGDIGYYHSLHRYENSPKFSYMIDGSYYWDNCPLFSVVR